MHMMHHLGTELSTLKRSECVFHHQQYKTEYQLWSIKLEHMAPNSIKMELQLLLSLYSAR